MSAREEIFSGIRRALAGLPARTEYPAYEPSAAEPRWLKDESDLVALFRKRIRHAGGLFFEAASESAEWLRAEGAKVVYLAPELEHLAGHFDGVCAVTRTFGRERVDEIDAAITVAAGGIAESGTVVLSDELTGDRLTALAPWRHIAALPTERLFRTIGEAIANFPDDPNIIWASGPSKTADVEGILIKGVHGPGHQGCFLI